MSVGVYVRVSTAEQAMNGHSIDEQIDRTRKYCEAMGWTIYRVYTDAGQSGASTNRPALQQMIRDIQSGRLDKVLVYKLDRLSRSQKDTLYLIEDVFMENHVDFVSMSESFDTSSAFGRAMIGILSVFAQLERETIKERMTMGKEARAKDGDFSGARYIPTGYDYVDGMLVPNEFEAMQIRQIYDRIQGGEPLNKIANDMNAAGLRPRTGKWSHQFIRRLVLQRTYIGEISYGGKWYPGKHQGIVTLEQFEQVKNVLDSRSEQYLQYNRRAGKANTLLGGLLVCKWCGAKYAKSTQRRKRKDGTESVREVFVCESRSKRVPERVKDPNCKNKNWKVDELTDMIVGEIKKLEFDSEYLEEITAESEETENNDFETIETELRSIENQINKLLDLYTAGTVPVSAVQQRINDLNDRRTGLENQRAELEKQKKDRPSADQISERVQSFEEVFQYGTFEQLRFIISQFIDFIELDGEDIWVHWAFE